MLKTEILACLIFASLFILLFLISEIIYRKSLLASNITRKIVHIGSGMISLFFPIFLNSHFSVLILSASFELILLISLKLNFLPSINNIDRVSYGSLLFPAAVYACFLAYVLFNYSIIYFYLPILILTICDPMAEIVGKLRDRGKFYIFKHKKTFSGSLTFFLLALIITFFSFYLFHTAYSSFWIIAGYSLLISLVTTIIEAISVKGLDNFSIPIGIIFILHLINV